jgi:prophage regulatory protein
MFEYPKTPQSIIIRLKEVITWTGLSRTTIYNKLNSKSSQFDSNFPSQIQLGASSVGWLELEINEWINNRIKQRDQMKQEA